MAFWDRDDLAVMGRRDETMPGTWPFKERTVAVSKHSSSFPSGCKLGLELCSRRKGPSTGVLGQPTESSEASKALGLG